MSLADTELDSQPVRMAEIIDLEDARKVLSEDRAHARREYEAGLMTLSRQHGYSLAAVATVEGAPMSAEGFAKLMRALGLDVQLSIRVISNV